MSYFIDDEPEPSYTGAGRFEIWFKRIFTVILLLWPDVIALDIFGSGLSTPAKIIAPLVIPSAKSNKKPIFPPNFDGGLDKKAFLASFRRQAHASLYECLKSTYPDLHSLVLVGMINKKGSLREVSTLNPSDVLPQCVGDSIREMNFAPLTTKLEKNELRLHWQIHW